MMMMMMMMMMMKEDQMSIVIIKQCDKCVHQAGQHAGQRLLWTNTKAFRRHVLRVTPGRNGAPCV